jgi:hypothetical protein
MGIYKFTKTVTYYIDIESDSQDIAQEVANAFDGSESYIDKETTGWELTDYAQEDYLFSGKNIMLDVSE